MNDWTAAWTRACALALTARTRRPTLRDPAAARLLRDCLREAVERRGLPLLGWVIVPGALHVIGACESPVPWPLAIGRVKQSFARRLRGSAPPGEPVWSTEVRVRPLAECDLPRALRALSEIPVREGLCPGPLDWPWGSTCQD